MNTVKIPGGSVKLSRERVLLLSVLRCPVLTGEITLSQVIVSTLLIVGGENDEVIELGTLKQIAQYAID